MTMGEIGHNRIGDCFNRPSEHDRLVEIRHFLRMHMREAAGGGYELLLSQEETQRLWDLADPNSVRGGPVSEDRLAATEKCLAEWMRAYVCLAERMASMLPPSASPFKPGDFVCQKDQP